jgi:hypothetical protein
MAYHLNKAVAPDFHRDGYVLGRIFFKGRNQ